LWRATARSKRQVDGKSSWHRWAVLSRARPGGSGSLVSGTPWRHDDADELRRIALAAGAGPTAFCPFPEATDYFGEAKQTWMVNFRVRDLDAMAAQLQAAGIAIEVDSQNYPNGRFARLHDLEGNPIELWQPTAPR
jgi:predicted enzyme related to lactoylglutathione lyase